MQVVEFGRTDTSRLVDRLKAICRAENLTVSGDTLRTLAAATDNDIRSCLNTLQFVRAEATRSSAGAGGDDAGTPRFRVTSDMIARAAVGLKDQTRALYDVLGAVFRKPDLRFRASPAALSEAPAALPPAEPEGGEGAAAETEGDGAAAAMSLRQDLLANAASAVRAAHFQELMGQVRLKSGEVR